MSKLYLVIVLMTALLMTSILTSSSVLVDWVKTPIIGTVNSISTAPDGSIYTTGFFSGSVVFEGQASLTSVGGTDIFVAKYNKKGMLLWAISAGASGNDQGKGISATDDAVFVSGYFSGSTSNKATFETTRLAGLSATDGTSDIFVAKYAINGTLLWVTAGGGLNSDIAGSISATKDAVFVCGVFYGKTSEKAKFGQKEISGFSSSYGLDMFVAKYDPSSGDVLWVKRAGTASTDEAKSISATNDGGAYVTGTFSGTTSTTVSFGNTIVNGMKAGSESLDIFIAKYSSSGDEEWVKVAGGDGADFGNGIVTTSDGGALVTGSIYAKKDGSTVKFGSNTVPGASTVAEQDIFVAKYDSTGNVEWATAAGGQKTDIAYSIAANNDGGGYITGLFGASSGNPAVFGSITLETTAANGINNCFVARYDKNGTALWAISCGVDTDTDYGYTVSSGILNGAVFGGNMFSDSTGTTKVGSTTISGLTASSGYAFLSQVDPPIYWCYGMKSRSKGVCNNNRGSCESNNVCVCTDDWAGFKCHKQL
jgi:hypothetical protein